MTDSVAEQAIVFIEAGPFSVLRGESLLLSDVVSEVVRQPLLAHLLPVLLADVQLLLQAVGRVVHLL